MRTPILLLLLRLLLPEVLVLLLPCSSIFFLIETQTLLFFFWVLFMGFVFKPSNYFSFLFFFFWQSLLEVEGNHGLVERMEITICRKGGRRVQREEIAFWRKGVTGSSKQMVKGLRKGLHFQNRRKQIARPNAKQSILKMKKIVKRLKRVIQTHP